VRPVLTPAEMADVDAAAPEPVDVLIERAGSAVAAAALRMLGGSYGRRVVIICGKGNNGNDGRAAARRLRARGVQVVELDAAALPAVLPDAHLVIDAAYGTGFRGAWPAPDTGATPVLAVDIPSGVDGATGVAAGPVITADETVTFAALKSGLLFHPGRSIAGRVTVADIGLDVSRTGTHLVGADDVARWFPQRAPMAHKWNAAVAVVAGSPGMLGAAHLSVRGAQRAGAGMVRLGVPGLQSDPLQPTEVVGVALPATGWAGPALQAVERCHAMVIGPGLGRVDATGAAVRAVVAQVPVPVVVDADALYHLAWSGDGAIGTLRGRVHPTVLTPHDGEFALLRGGRVGPDRIAAAKALAADLRSVVLLKGATTVVAAPDGRVLLVTEGDERLATAGTGDVLSGVLGALLSRGVPAFEAAGAAAFLHGRAARHGHVVGMVAGDLPDLLPQAFADVLGSPPIEPSTPDAHSGFQPR
jgi:ADP-dependent NAD(P)H-hydrate dehydratase / NAD(P)H-hydrate epimerase